MDVAFVLVPRGPFAMGTRPEEVHGVVDRYPMVDASWIEKEAPRREVFVGDFYIARTPVTNALWSAFAGAGGPEAPSMKAGGRQAEASHPVWGINFADLLAFCDWCYRRAGCLVRPPTETEWEKAARGTDGREYPWGDEFDPRFCNTVEGKYGGTTSVDRFSAGASPYGLLDMAGNVEEWTSDLYWPYPGGRVIYDAFGGPGSYQVTRGGSWFGHGDLARCARRHGARTDSFVGARLVYVPTTGGQR